MPEQGQTAQQEQAQGGRLGDTFVIDEEPKRSVGQVEVEANPPDEAI